MKKLLTALVVALLLWALPSVVLAETSGTCPNDLTWTLTDDGVLTINGEGWMYDFPAYSLPSWNAYASSITSVVIENGVENIGNFAFYNCVNLTSVSIPDSVTRIGDSAFKDCTSLSSISVPDTVTQIGSYAFSQCPLSSFDFPSGMTQINAGVFSYSAFTSFTVPEHITHIGDSAFYGCENLSSVTLHNNITEIESYAFTHCPELKTVSIPDDVSVSTNSFDCNSTILYLQIGSPAMMSLSTAIVYFRDPDYPDCILYYGNYGSGNGLVLQKYDNPESTHVVIPEEVVYIAPSACYENTTITSVTLPESLIEIGQYAFSGCTNLENVSIPNKVTTIGHSAFWKCSALTGMFRLPDSVTHIYNSAFFDCTGLTGLVLPESAVVEYQGTIDLYTNRDSETALQNSYVIPGFCFIDPEYPELYLNTGKTEEGKIYYEVVDAKPSITKIDASSFPEGTTHIASSAFSDCDKLLSVTIPEYITTLGRYAFSYCDNLTSVTYNAQHTVLPAQSFSHCPSLRSVTLPDSLKTIEGYAFDGCKQLTSIDIPDQLTELQEGTFSGCGLKSIYLPASIGKVGSFVFYDCPSLRSVTLADGITAIEDYAFAGVRSMESMYIPASCISIGEQTYVEKRGLETITHHFSYQTTDVYCYEFSYAEHWGNSKCRQAILLDGKDTDEILTVSIPEELLASTDLPFTIPASIFPVTNDQVVTWTSSRPTVATIDNEGVLTPLNAGVTTITLTVNGVSASCTVTVRASLKSMLLPETVYAVAKGSVQLPLQIVPADAAVELTYTMAADNFGSISSTGWITAPSYITTPSTTTITVRDQMSGKEATTQLCITYPVTAISFAQPTVQVMGGESALLTANVTMRSDSCVNQLVTFTSSDTSIATVDAFGCVKGFKPGSATITATADSGVTATCEVIVGASGLSGDLSGDEAVTVDDVLALMDSLADPDGYSDVADVDKDADVDQDDMLLLMQYLSGWGVKLQ